MNAKTVVWILAGGVMLGAIAFAWHVHQRTDAAGTTLAELRGKQPALDASLQQRQAEIDENEKQRAGLTAALAKLKSAPPASSKGAQQPDIKKLTQNPMELIARDPKLQVLYLASKRASVAASYGPLFRKLGLTPEQVDRMAVALTKAEEQKQDALAIQREQRLPPDDPGLVALRQRAAEELSAAQLEVLGADGAEQLRQYQRTMPARTIVDRFAGAAALADVALSGSQADQLVQTMAEASPGHPGGANTAEMKKVDWDKVDTQAATFLTPVQLALFQRIEPLGGGSSRWNARLDRVMEQAVEQARKSVGPAKSPGG